MTDQNVKKGYKVQSVSVFYLRARQDRATIMTYPISSSGIDDGSGPSGRCCRHQIRTPQTHTLRKAYLILFKHQT